MVADPPRQLGGVVVADVDAVQRHVIFVHLQATFVVVADVTALPGSGSVSSGHVRMTPRALHVEALDVAVVEGQAALLDNPVRHGVAVGALRRAFTHGLILEVTEDAGRRGDGDVAALDDL